jgi:hypothetical protein
MNFGLFEPLFGKQIPKQHNFIPNESEKTPPAAAAPAKKRAVQASVVPPGKHPTSTVELLNNNQLGELFGELDKSKVIILVLAIAVAVMFVFYFYLNTRQKSQKQLIYKMQKQLKRLRG